MLFWAQSKGCEPLKTPTMIIIPANIQNVSAQHGRLILNRLPPLGFGALGRVNYVIVGPIILDVHVCKQWPMKRHVLGRTLAKFTQLKRNKRFDNFIMLVGVQGSLFHIAVGSHPVQEAWGSQDSLYRGQIQKLIQWCQKPYQQIPLIITIQKKYSLTYLRRTVSYLLKKRSEVKNLVLQGSNR